MKKEFVLSCDKKLLSKEGNETKQQHLQLQLDKNIPFVTSQIRPEDETKHWFVLFFFVCCKFWYHGHEYIPQKSAFHHERIHIKQIIDSVFQLWHVKSFAPSVTFFSDGIKTLHWADMG